MKYKKEVVLRILILSLSIIFTFVCFFEAARLTEIIKWIPKEYSNAARILFEKEKTGEVTLKEGEGKVLAFEPILFSRIRCRLIESRIGSIFFGVLSLFISIITVVLMLRHKRQITDKKSTNNGT